ncbi:unnamed protein product, partial [Rotaria sp. Silwood1]
MSKNTRSSLDLHATPISELQYKSSRQQMKDELQLEQIIHDKFTRHSDNGDAEKWLSQTVTQFKQYELSTSDQLQALPYLLEDIAYLWYVEHMDLITSFESFNKLFLQQFSSTSSTVRSNTPTETVMPSVVASSSLLTSH